jgi:hypothetical protein
MSSSEGLDWFIGAQNVWDFADSTQPRGWNRGQFNAFLTAGSQ